MVVETLRPPELGKQRRQSIGDHRFHAHAAHRHETAELPAALEHVLHVTAAGPRDVREDAAHDQLRRVHGAVAIGGDHDDRVPELHPDAIGQQVGDDDVSLLQRGRAPCNPRGQQRERPQLILGIDAIEAKGRGLGVVAEHRAELEPTRVRLHPGLGAERLFDDRDIIWRQHHRQRQVVDRRDVPAPMDLHVPEHGVGHLPDHQAREGPGGRLEDDDRNDADRDERGSQQRPAAVPCEIADRDLDEGAHAAAPVVSRPTRHPSSRRNTISASAITRGSCVENTNVVPSVSLMRRIVLMTSAALA